MLLDTRQIALERKYTNSFSRPLFLFCGILLMSASALKAIQVARGEAAIDGLSEYRPVTVSIVIIESLLGLWFICGTCPYTIRYIGVLCFGFFGVASIYQAILGRRSCGCFGYFQIAPWLMAIVDFLLAFFLCWLAPPHRAWWTRLAAFSIATAVAAAIVASWQLMPPTPDLPHLITSPPTVDFGVIRAGGRAEAHFELFNGTGQKIQIQSIESSCPCLFVHHEKTSIESGQSTQASVFLILESEPHFTGSLEIEVTARSINGQQIYHLKAMAVVK